MKPLYTQALTVFHESVPLRHTSTLSFVLSFSFHPLSFFISLLSLLTLRVRLTELDYHQLIGSVRLLRIVRCSWVVLRDCLQILRCSWRLLTASFSALLIVAWFQIVSHQFNLNPFDLFEQISNPFGVGNNVEVLPGCRVYCFLYSSRFRAVDVDRTVCRHPRHHSLLRTDAQNSVFFWQAVKPRP